MRVKPLPPLERALYFATFVYDGHHPILADFTGVLASFLEEEWHFCRVRHPDGADHENRVIGRHQRPPSGGGGSGGRTIFEVGQDFPARRFPAFLGSELPAGLGKSFVLAL